MKNYFISSSRFAKAFRLMTFAALISFGKSDAQCLTSNLDVTTGTYNYTPVPMSSMDPLWYCINKTGDFTASPPPIGSNAIVVVPHAAWAGGGNWICDNQAHVTPGIITTTPSTLTFERRFNLCSDDRISFNLAFRSDGNIDDVLVDGVSTGFFQTSANWFGGPLWPAAFSVFLPAGSHALQVVVSDPIPSYTFGDPIGFLMNGSLFSPLSVLFNDQDPVCAGRKCDPHGPIGGKAAPVVITGEATANVLYQNSPNPLIEGTAIKYSVANMRNSAAIVICDQVGKELEIHAVQPGEGTLNISKGRMTPGIYTYSLIVDGKTIDTKKMMIAK